jgi:soluble lytic murein transglycosylase-like protein
MHIPITNQFYVAFKGRNLSDAPSITEAIRTYAPDSPITGEMVISSAKKYGVEPEAILALMGVESSMGTKGMAVGTKNPGNVGNYTGKKSTSYNTWQEGLDVLAYWLNNHKV